MFSHQAWITLLFMGVLTAPLPAEPPRDRGDDPLPEGAIARLGSLRLRPLWPVFSGAFSPDGKLLATGGGMVTGRGMISFWDPATGKEVRRLRIDLPFRVHGLRFSSDGKSIILVGNSGGILILDAASGTEKRRINPPGDLPLLALDVARDGKTAVTTSFRGSIIVWDLESGERLREFNIPRNLLHWFDRAPFNPITILTPDGKQLVLPRPDGSLDLMDVATGKKVVSFEMPAPQPGVPPRLSNVAVSPDGRYLTYSGPFIPGTLCDLKTGKRLHILTPAGRNVALLFMSDSRSIAVVDGGELRFVDTDSGKEVRKSAKSSWRGHPLALSPDGKILALREAEHAISLWDVSAGRPMHSSVRHVDLVQSIVFFPDGKRLASSDSFGSLIVWDIATGQELAHLGKPADVPRSLAVDVDGQSLRFRTFDGVIRRWNPTAGLETTQQKIPQANLVAEVALSPDGRTLAATIINTPFSQATLFDLQSGKAMRTITIPNKERVGYLLFSSDNRRLLTGGADSTFRLWDRDTGRLLHELPWEDPRRGPGYGILAHDGRSIAYFDYTLGYHLGIREFASGGVRLRIPLKDGGNPLAYSPDGRFLACAAYPAGGVLLLGTATGKEVTRWQGPQESVYSLTFSPDSRLLASGYGDGTILLWKMPDGEGLPATLKAEEAAELWRTLADVDAARANRALAGLAAAPAQAVPLIKERFRIDWKKPNAEQVARWIAELDDDNFKVRERAASELVEAGADVAADLRKALANNPTVEAKRRLEGLLNRLSKGGGPERLRSLRAIEVLERIGTPKAKELLRELSRKSLPADLEDDIHASLHRMGERP